MNRICLIGRLTAKPEIRYTPSNVCYSRFNIAVNRPYSKENGERIADFISCVAWEERAELITKYFDKGSQIGIEGHIQTGSYEKDNGEKVYTTDVIVDSITFLEKKKDTQETPVEEKQDLDPFADFGEQVDMDSLLD